MDTNIRLLKDIASMLIRKEVIVNDFLTPQFQIDKLNKLLERLHEESGDLWADNGRPELDREI